MLTAVAPVRAVPALVLGRLSLPLPDTAFAHCDRHGHEWSDEVQYALPGPDDNVRVMHRWLLGHHAAFCVWRLIAEIMAAPQDDPRQSADTVAALMDCYSALLLYTGSCTRAAYEATVRPAMLSWHAAFSGTWARDYEHISPWLKLLARNAGTSRVREAVKFNRLVHATLAARLVPSGASLLRSAGRTAAEQPTDEERDLFDGFFLTAREPVCRHAFLAQFAERARSIVRDVRRFPPAVRYDRAAVTRFQSHVEDHIERASAIAEATLTREAN